MSKLSRHAPTDKDDSATRPRQATHAESHHPRTIIGANGDRYSSKLADHGARLKDNKHSHYLHDGNAIGFAYDSMGGIPQSAKDCIDHLYARGEQEKRQRWDSETMRIALKKGFLDRLSMVLCIHLRLQVPWHPQHEGGRCTTRTSSSSNTSCE
eukprot:GHVN01079921.1.p2 GENE.GHVN01079921.1~~GHVN01079921.1.p2  ORF type:complete len:154 (-),score=4.27 GHVN01079921.1:78-539(-)